MPTARSVLGPLPGQEGVARSVWTAPAEPRQGFFATLISETAADFAGAGRTAAAGLLSPLALMGANVPITVQDLTERDMRGALMTLALAGGGVVGGAAKSLPLISRIGTTGALQRAGTTAAAEAAAGAAFGIIRPLNEDESRMRAVLGDAALFSAFGAGASFAKSATMATVGGVVGQMRRAQSISATAQAFKSIEDESVVRQLAGVQLLNPGDNARAAVFRDFDDPLKAVFVRMEGGKFSEKVFRGEGAFDQALAEAWKGGFHEAHGPIRSSVDAISGASGLSTELLKRLSDTGDDAFKALAEVRLGEYASVREAAKAAVDADQSVAHLAAELLTESVDEYGVYKLNQSTKTEILNQLAVTPAEKKLLAQNPLSSPEIIRRGIMQGVVSVENVAAGSRVNQWMREFAYNGLLPDGAIITVNPAMDAFGAKILTSRTIAKLHPVVQPLVDAVDNAAKTQELRRQHSRESLFGLREKLGRTWKDKGIEAQKAKEIIDASADKALGFIQPEAANAKELFVQRAREIAVQDAKATGDQRIIDAVEGATEFLGGYLDELVETGLLTDGRAGYFPIVNASQWKLEVQNAGKAEFKGFHATREAAEAEAAAVLRQNPFAKATTVPHTFSWDPDSLGMMSAKTAAKVTQKAQSGFLKERRLGMRDFEDVGFLETLEIYAGSSDRVLAFNGLDSVSRQVIDQIPAANPNLKMWSERLVDDALGRPGAIEQHVQAVASFLNPNTKPRVLRRYMAAIRRWESFSRLGGVMSGLVNTTQIAINTNAAIGPRWTIKGLEALYGGPKKWKEITATMSEHGVDVGFITPLADAGGIAGHDTIRGLFKQGRNLEALNNMALFLFNGTERMNRVATWWGAFEREKAKGGLVADAARIATEVMERTQFNYRLSNTPELLRNPVGATLFQFKSFMINEMEFIASLTPAEAARMGVAMQALGGLAIFFNVPGPDVLSAAKGMFFDRTLEEDAILGADPESAWKKFTVFGLPGIMNVDLSGYVGVGGFGDLARGLLGPAASDVQALGSFLGQAAADIGSGGFVTNGTKNAALQRMMPSAMRRFQRGYDIMQTGEVRNPYSAKLVYRPADRMRAAVAQMIGMPTIEMQQERVMDDVVTRVRDRFLKARTSFAKEAARHYIDGESTEAQNVVGEARASGFPLSRATIDYWVGELRRTGPERRFRRTPTSLRSRDDYLRYYEATGEIPAERLQELRLTSTR